MRTNLLLAALTLLALSGCMLERSGTRQGGGIDAGPAPADAAGSDAAGTDAARPDAGACVGGDMRDVTCGACGSEPERCESGTWISVGMCVETPPCTSGATETETSACGACGTRERTRTCGGCSGWGEFGAWGSCTGEGMCLPGDVRTADRGCGSCGGTMTVTESCDGMCGWTVSSMSECVEATCTHPFSRRVVCDGEGAVFGCESGSIFGARTCTCDGSTGDFGSCVEIGC